MTPQYQQNSAKRNVRFAPEPTKVVGTVLHLEEYTPRELDACWWTEDDMQGFRFNAQYIASRARKSSLLRNVARVYKRTRDATDCATSEHFEKKRQNGLHTMEENQDCRIPRNRPHPKELIPHLEKWSQTAHSVRGLERLACPVIFELRKADARAACNLVLDYSQNGWEVANAYRQKSMTSSLFARLVGHADSVAADREYGSLRMCATHFVKQTECNQTQTCTGKENCLPLDKETFVHVKVSNKPTSLVNVPVHPIHSLEKREINTRAA